MHPVKRILFTVLNWGLGHAVRSMPIINHLIANGNQVTIGSDGPAGLILREAFPEAEYIELPGYHITYQTRFFMYNMISQIPGIMQAINKEHRIISELHSRKKFDLLITDNRYGSFQPDVESIMISHQLTISPGIANIALNRYLSRFNQIWIPDLEGSILSGQLSDTSFRQEKIKREFIGFLSNLQQWPLKKEYDAIAVLSGPEPARTRFQQALLLKMQDLPDLQFMLLGGTPESQAKKSKLKNVTFQPYADRKTLSKILAQSEVVISRSGYTSLMDYLKLRKKMILVPTPGQPEQLLLARRMKERNWAVIQHEASLDIESAFQQLHKIQPADFNDGDFQLFSEKIDLAMTS